MILIDYFRRVRLFLTKSVHEMKGVKIGIDSKIHDTVHLELGYHNSVKGILEIERQNELCRGVVIKCYGGKVRINENSFLGEYVTIYGHGGVEIGGNCLIAMHTCIVSSNHTVPDRDTLIRSQGDILLPVKIGSDVWIGAGVKILGGVTIGDGCVIGAGSVVNKDLPAYSISVGIPATVIRSRDA